MSRVISNENFEQRIVFKLARWLPQILGALATLALIIFAIALVYAYSPNFEPKEPEAIPYPSPVQLSVEDVKAGVKATKPEEMVDAPLPSEDESSGSEIQKAADPRLEKIAGELSVLIEQLLSRDVPFSDVKRTECAQYFWENCYRVHEVVVREGVADDLFEMLKIYDEAGEAERGSVEIPGSGLTLTVPLNGGLDHKITVLSELNKLLKPVSANESEKFVRNWISVRMERENEQKANYQKKLDEQYEKYSEESHAYADAVSRKQGMRSTVMLGIVSALGLLVVCGLILAVLAIERHTRALKDVAEKLSERSTANPT